MREKTLFKCNLFMYGLEPAITTLRSVELELNDGANMAEVVGELKKKVPSLEGPVIQPGQNRLGEAYKFNINGHFFYDGMDFDLHEGDRIALLTPATGG